MFQRSNSTPVETSILQRTRDSVFCADGVPYRYSRSVCTAIGEPDHTNMSRLCAFRGLPLSFWPASRGLHRPIEA